MNIAYCNLQTSLFYILLLLPFPISFRAFLQKSHKKSHKLLNILPNISNPSQPSLVHHGKLQLTGAHESHRLGIRRHMVSLDPELLRRDSAPAKNHQLLKEFRPFRKWRTQIATDWCLFLSGGENISRKVHTILYSFSAWMRSKSFRTSLAALWRPSSPSNQVSNMCDSTVRQDHTGSSESGM